MLYVIKRDGRKETVRFDKITERISRLINPVELQGLDIPNLDISREEEYLDPVLIAQKVVASLYPGITTEELDIESANICINLSTTHPSYSYLGGRILISNLHKKTLNTFSDKMILLSNETNNINKDWLQYVIDNADELNNIIDYNRDYVYDYFAFKTLEKSYLLKSKGKVIERPQDTLLRTAITLQQGNLELIKKTYNYMSLGYYTHASPTLYNSGTNHMQLSSCFVAGTEVLTINGVKKIENVLIGDNVITHTGKIQRVSQTHKNLLDDRKVMELLVYGTKPINVTNNHKFWSITDKDKIPKWRSVDELNANTKIAMPSYKSDNCNINFLPSGKYILSLLCGYFVSSCYIMDKKVYVYGNHVLKTLFESFVLDVFNIKPIVGNGNIYYNDERVLEVFTYMLDIKVCNNLQSDINFNKLLSWDSKMIDCFVNGLFINNSINLDNSSSTNQLYHILRLFGYCVSINKNTLTLMENNSRTKDIEIVNNTKFLKVVGIKETDLKPKYVYTLGVDDDHSYNVEGLICENCFLLGTNDDLTDISTTWNSCAQISKWSGGIGLHVSNIRGKDSLIKGTGGKSNGLVPFLKVFNEIARWIDQGGRRPGSIAIYLEPHHPDIFEFLELRKNFGAETERARDLFLALWISDLFMKQVEADGDWYLFSADDCPKLTDAYGDEYEKLYYEYVNKKLYRNKVQARKVWMAILESQIETGMPYIGFKDHINRKSNQKNIGTIKSSNLCVHEDTLVLTDKGHIRIKDLENQKVNVWNGEEWSETTIRKTGTNKNLVRVTLDNGCYLDCTPEHNFYIYDNNNNIIKTDASKLLLDDKLIKFRLPNDNNYNNVKVLSVEQSYQNVDTYCFTEPKRHMGMFNGILTGQCIEIAEYSDHEEYAVCNLASIALKTFVKPFDKSLVNKWVIYTKPNCKYCKYAKTFFNNNGIKYTELDGLEHLEYLKNTLSKEQITFPQIFINNATPVGANIDKSNATPVGGWSDLYKFYKGTFDFEKLYEVAYLATVNLDKVIDINYYPVPQAKKSNMRHRPIGLGIQGLADALVLMKIPFDSEEAVQLNEVIMETIYLASVTASNDIAKSRYENMNKLIDYVKDKYYPEYYETKFNFSDNNMNVIYHELKPNKFELTRQQSEKSGSYSTFEGSPFSQGLFQFDLWNKEPSNKDAWANLRNQVKQFGTRNSLLTALMPTASTSQILGNNECFEFFTNNIYTRKTQSGDFMLVNKYLINDLIDIGLWSSDLKDMIIASNGSIQQSNLIPQEIKDLYKTIWEIKQVWVLKSAVARGPYVDQTQSMNIFMGEPDYKRLGSSHFWGWKNGLKTGMYYLRTKPAVDAIKFTINPELFKQKEDTVCENCSA